MEAQDRSEISPEPGPMRFGLFLNMGAQLMDSPEEVFAFTAEQAELAEQLGYDDLWVTEHHFIPFGLNPSALTTAGFLLGRTRRLRVGTAVALSPLYHPVDLVERAALLSQLSGGRFDLGVGRGGYVRDYEVFGVDPGRWDIEPEATLAVVLEAIRSQVVSAESAWFSFDDVRIEPRIPHPSALGLFAATSSKAGIEFAAQNQLPLQFYFALPVAARKALVDQYRAAHGGPGPCPDHLHTLIAVVSDDPDRTRSALHDALTDSFHAGDWPAVPQARERHVDADGKPLSREKMASSVAQTALVGPPDVLVDELGALIEATGARRFAFYVEAIADREATLKSIERLRAEVIPILRERFD